MTGDGRGTDGGRGDGGAGQVCARNDFICRFFHHHRHPSIIPPHLAMPPARPGNAILHAISSPPFIYGTAWKKDATQKLVKDALAAGFVAVDTAAQPRHYQEPLVGAGIRDALTAHNLKREQIYVCA